jgi:hypothetical protein
MIEALVAAGLAPVGLRTTMVALESVEETVEESVEGPAAPGGPTVRLQVVDVRSAYTLVDSAGRVVHEEPAAPQRRWMLTLGAAPAEQEVGDDGASDPEPGWRVHEVEPIG